jgi:RNA polymerase sigma factor (sigma-70 family)
MNDDADLLRRYAEDRSEADFTAWVQRRFDLVYSAALRQLQGDHHRAREVAQVVFVDAARKAGKLARHPALVGWLYTSTHFAVQKLIRSESRRQVREGAALALADLGAAPAEPGWRDLRPLLDTEMLALGAGDRQALLLRFFEQRPLADIGSELRLTENAARMRVDRALEKLRQRLARRGVTSTAAALAAGQAGHAVTAAPAGLSAAVAGSSLAEIATLGAAGGAALLAPLMASKITTGVLAACGLAALGTGVYFGAQTRGAENAILALRAECGRLEAGLQGVPAARASEGARAAAIKSVLAQKRAAKSGEGPAPVGSALLDAMNREAAENPQLRQALARNYLAEFRLTYAPLAQALGLTEAQVNQLALAHLKMISDLFDLAQADRLLGKDSDTDAAYRTLAQPAKDAYASVLLGMVGPQGVQRFQDYDRALPAQEVANQVAAGSFYSAAPLTAAQADALTHILTNASPAFQQGGTVDLGAVDWTTVLSQAEAQLPPPQLAALRAWRAQRESRQLADVAEGGTP